MLPFCQCLVFETTADDRETFRQKVSILVIPVPLLKSFSVGERGHAGALFEAFGEVGLIVETCVDGDLADTVVAGCEEALGFLDSSVVDVAQRGESEDFAEPSVEVGGGKSSDLCKLGGVDVFEVVFVNELHGGVQFLKVGCLCGGGGNGIHDSK